MPESPTWLLNQGRTKDAIKVLNFIGRLNGVTTQLSPSTLFKEAKQAPNDDVMKATLSNKECQIETSVYINPENITYKEFSDFAIAE